MSDGVLPDTNDCADDRTGQRNEGDHPQRPYPTNETLVVHGDDADLDAQRRARDVLQSDIVSRLVGVRCDRKTSIYQYADDKCQPDASLSPMGRQMMHVRTHHT